MIYEIQNTWLEDSLHNNFNEADAVEAMQRWQRRQRKSRMRETANETFIFIRACFITSPGAVFMLALYLHNK